MKTFIEKNFSNLTKKKIKNKILINYKNFNFNFKNCVVYGASKEAKIFIKEGIVLEDSQGQKYICGEILNKEKPLTLKLLKKSLNWKLLIYPELYLGEEYYKGNIKIENGTIYDFLNLNLQ